MRACGCVALRQREGALFYLWAAAPRRPNLWVQNPPSITTHPTRTRCKQTDPRRGSDQRISSFVPASSVPLLHEGFVSVYSRIYCEQPTRRVGQTRPAGRQPPTAPQTILLFLARAPPPPPPTARVFVAGESLWLGASPLHGGWNDNSTFARACGHSASCTTLTTNTHACNTVHGTQRRRRKKKQHTTR